MKSNAKMKAVEESFEGHEAGAGAVDGISQVTHLDEPVDEPTKEHQIQLAGDLPDAGIPDIAMPDPAPAKRGKTLEFPKKKEKGAGGGMKNFLAKLKDNKKMLGGAALGVALFGGMGFLAYSVVTMQGKLARMDRAAMSMERMRADLQRGGGQAEGGIPAAQLNQYLNDVAQKISILDRRLAQLENAPPQAAAPVAAAPSRPAAKKVATAKKADRAPASLKKAGKTKKRR